MERHRQSAEDLVLLLSPIRTSWRDAHATEVLQAIERIPSRIVYTPDEVAAILDDDFRAGLTTVQLLLELSKDELAATLRDLVGGTGIQAWRADRERFLDALVDLGAVEALQGTVSREVTWRDLLAERLKAGRGSAIKGQQRGRYLEDQVEAVVRTVFEHYDARCRFLGAGGTHTEKADFAIPSKDDPHVLIEVKAYGATGSKQTDVLGDIERIVAQKRHDTDLLLVTDGVTWKARMNDLRKLCELQNRGVIRRIYTQKLTDELELDLRHLKHSHAL